MIGMRVGGDEVIQRLDFVALECIENNFALAPVAGIDKHGLSGGGDNQNGIAFDRANVEHVHLKFSAGWCWQTSLPPRQAKLQKPYDASSQQEHQDRNRTSTSACSLHSLLTMVTILNALGLKPTVAS